MTEFRFPVAYFPVEVLHFVVFFALLHRAQARHHAIDDSICTLFHCGDIEVIKFSLASHSFFSRSEQWWDRGFTELSPLSRRHNDCRSTPSSGVNLLRSVNV